jgi:hypothetical protein
VRHGLDAFQKSNVFDLFWWFGIKTRFKTVERVLGKDKKSDLCRLVKTHNGNEGGGRVILSRSRWSTALHLRQKSIISSGPASACAPAVGAPHTDSQCLPVSELLIISTLATAKPRAEAEAEAEADSKHFDTNGAF